MASERQWKSKSSRSVTESHGDKLPLDLENLHVTLISELTATTVIQVKATDSALAHVVESFESFKLSIESQGRHIDELDQHMNDYSDCIVALEQAVEKLNSANKQLTDKVEDLETRSRWFNLCGHSWTGRREWSSYIYVTVLSRCAWIRTPTDTDAVGPSAPHWSCSSCWLRESKTQCDDRTVLLLSWQGKSSLTWKLEPAFSPGPQSLHLPWLLREGWHSQPWGTACVRRTCDSVSDFPPVFS